MTGTSPNDDRRQMTSPLATLYIIGGAPPGDPLDCVAAATPFLAPHFTAIHAVGPDQPMSVRAMRRAYEPGVDRLLYDFTALADYDWALDMLAEAPGAVLVGRQSPIWPSGVMTGLRSARRYIAGAHRFPSGATVGALDAPSEGAIGHSLNRPAITLPSTAEAPGLAMAVEPDAIETAYAALKGLAGGAATTLTLLASTRRDANDLTDIRMALGLAEVRVRYIRSRSDIADAVSAVSGLIIAADEARLGISDAAFAARCVGAQILTLTSPAGAADAATSFVEGRPVRDAAAASAFTAARPIQTFANDLHTLIETGPHHALPVGEIA